MTTNPVGGAKKKLNRADYMFSQKEGETLVKKPGDIAGLEFAIRYLTNCNASVFDQTAQVNKNKISLDLLSLTNFSSGNGRQMQRLHHYIRPMFRICICTRL